ncbi:hypothetical protein GLU60_02770 [Nanohaloarchaea archaeon H01]|nr:hypothetical protein [Nanohaloarchaea archaeon H01]
MSKAARYTEILYEATSNEEVAKVLTSFDTGKEEIKSVAESEEILLTESQREFLENYFESLDSMQSWTKKIRSEEESRTKQEIITEINQLLNRLEGEIQRAVDEDRTLEQIAAALRDGRLTEEAERIMAELERPKARLERLAEKKSQTKEMLEKFESLREKTGGDHNLDSALRHRKATVEAVLENSRERDSEKVKLDIPPWEESNFDEDYIYVEAEQSDELDSMLKLAKDMVELTDDETEMNPDMSKSVAARHAEIGYARRVRKITSGAKYDVFDHQSGGNIRVWMNAGVTKFDQVEKTSLGVDRLIIVDTRLFSERAALLATLVHELMHAYFEHKPADFSHKKIHQMAEAVLRVPVEKERMKGSDFTIEDFINSRPANGEIVNKAYLYALASEDLFPG